MNNTQEIIIYRNPLEQQMYHAMQTGTFFVILCGIVTFFVVLFTLEALLKRKAWRGNDQSGTISMIVSVLAGIGVIWYML